MPVGVLKFSLWNVNGFFPVSYLNPLMRVYYMYDNAYFCPTSFSHKGSWPSAIAQYSGREKISKPTVSLMLAWVGGSFFLTVSF